MNDTYRGYSIRSSTLSVEERTTRINPDLSVSNLEILHPAGYVVGHGSVVNDCYHTIDRHIRSERAADQYYNL